MQRVSRAGLPAAEKRSLPQAAWRSEFGRSRKARSGE